MLANKGLKLEAVIELRVDERALVKRIESRVKQMQARGEPLRPDDSPEVLHRRVFAYRDQTTPLVTYYKLQGVLRTVDGMASIPDVAAEIDKLLAPAKRWRGQKAQSGQDASACQNGHQTGQPAAAKKPVGKATRAAVKTACCRPKADLTSGRRQCKRCDK